MSYFVPSKPVENIPLTVGGAWAADEASPSNLTLAREIKELHDQLSQTDLQHGEGGKKKSTLAKKPSASQTSSSYTCLVCISATV